MDRGLVSVDFLTCVDPHNSILSSEKKKKRKKKKKKRERLNSLFLAFFKSKFPRQSMIRINLINLST